jgi:hypothetical protein
MKKYGYILFFIFIATSVFAQSGIQLVTTLSKNKLGIHQRLRVDFTVNRQGADHFELPKLEEFEVVGGPSSSINQSWINGKSSYKQTYTYIIKPKRVGVFSIPSASISYQGNRIESNPVEVTVLLESDVPKDVNDPHYIASENVHLVAEISKEEPYVGEGIYVVYKLFFSNKVGFNNWRIEGVPQYDGFFRTREQTSKQSDRTNLSELTPRDYE